MATKSLGTLTLDLIAKIGGFTGPMDRAARNAEKNAKQMERAAKRAREQWALYGKVALGAITAIAGVGLTRFIRETKEAEQRQAQLAAVLRSTGEAAGFSRGTLNEMARTMEAISTFSSNDITDAQTTLLAFTGIVGDEFPRALQAAMDMATRTGMQVSASAELIGRALDIPSKGLTALSRQGFRFSEEQKKLAQYLESTGRTADAQRIILNALEESYSGAAQAARDTFGGSLTSLSNTISALLTGDGGTLTEATQRVNELNEALQDRRAKQGVDAIIGAMFSLVGAAVDAGIELTDLGDRIGYTVASLTGNIGDIVKLESEIESIDKALSSGVFSKPIRFLFTSDEDLQRLREQKQLALDILTGIDSASAAGNDSAPTGAPDGDASGFDFAELEFLKDVADAAKKAGEEAAKAREKINGMVDNEVARLREQIALSGEVSELDRIRYAITSGSLVGVNDEQQRRLEGLAAELDAIKATADAERERAEQERQIIGDYESARAALLTQEQALEEAAGERFRAIEAAFVAGIIGEQAFGEMAARNTELLNEQLDKLKESIEEMDEFTKTAARSIQNELSNALVAGFDGGGDDLLKRWKNLLKRMIADAVAADLTRSLFGMGAAGSGQFGTADLVSGIGGLFAGFFDAGGNIPAGKFGIVGERGPELVSGPATVTGRQDTAAMLSGGGTKIGNVTMSFPGVSNAREAEIAAGGAARKFGAALAATQRYA